MAQEALTPIINKIYEHKATQPEALLTVQCGASYVT